MRPQDDAAETTERLLRAHTAFVMERLEGDTFVALVHSTVDDALELASGLVLEDVVTREQVTAVALKYVDAFRLPGAIPEVAGDIALRLRSHSANDTALGELLTRDDAQALAGKIAEMRGARVRVVDGIADSPSVRVFLTEVLHSLATDTLAANRRLVERIPLAGSALSMGERVAKAPLRRADEVTRELADRMAGTLLERWRDAVEHTLTDEQVAEALLDLWAEHSDRPVAEVFDVVDEDDLVDLIVVGYEIWLHLRHTRFLHAVVSLGVDYFYDTYGGFTLDALLEEFGLGRDDLVEEGLRFGPPALDALREAGILEPLVRRQLAAFYDSPAARAALRTPGSPTDQA